VYLALDFVYVPTADVDAAIAHYVDILGGELAWKVRGMSTVVANIRLSAVGPAVLLSEHLEGEIPILIYRVENYRNAIATLRSRGVTGIRELEIPHGPCASFLAAGGQRLAIYELTRPEAARHFDGRIDP
jgi:hypothetical protein